MDTDIKTFVDNIQRNRALKAQYAKKTTEEFDNNLGPLVQVIHTMIQEKAVLSNFKDQTVAVKSYVTAQAEFDNYQAEFDAATPAGKVALKESLNNSRAILEKADQDIQILERLKLI
jgi:hypothetical protein